MTQEEQLYALMAVAQEQQAAADASIKALRAEVDALGKASKNAFGGLSRDVKASVLEVAKEGIAAGVGPLNRAARDADLAADRLDQALSSVNWRTASIYTCTLFAVLLSFIGAGMWFLPTPAEISHLKAEKKYYEAEVAKLKTKMKVENCGDRKIPCVRVDLKKGAFGADGDYFILK